MQYSLSDFPLNLNISVLLGMYCNYDAVSISIQLTDQRFFHMINRIITNLAILGMILTDPKKDVEKGGAYFSPQMCFLQV
jgi:hypothetical protein